MLLGFAVGLVTIVGLAMGTVLVGCWVMVRLSDRDSEKAGMVQAARERQDEVADLRRQINKLGGFA